ncbi:MAG: rRNA maturation RNase YbeY [Chloroflexaceae bacterium]|nr:rRNA maturation RNase YbeY [Chloroflexaceae bacterium]
MVGVHVAPSVDSAVDLPLIQRTVALVLKYECVGEPIEVGVFVADDTALQQYNRLYRGIDAPTDVLSFVNDTDETPFQSLSRYRYLGDLALSYERVQAQATQYGHAVERELAYLVTHGMLHLLGYDHERDEAEANLMRSHEEAIMHLLGLSRLASDSDSFALSP